jgi:hypothetical protein
MENTSSPPIDYIFEKLDALNAAWTLFRKAETENEEQKADAQFALLYDWFTEHNISIVYIKQTKLYTLDGRQDLSTYTNSLLACLDDRCTNGCY